MDKANSVGLDELVTGKVSVIGCKTEIEKKKKIWACSDKACYLLLDHSIGWLLAVKQNTIKKQKKLKIHKCKNIGKQNHKKNTKIWDVMNCWDKAVSLLLTSGRLLAVKLTKTATDYVRRLTVIAYLHSSYNLVASYFHTLKKYFLKPTYVGFRNTCLIFNRIYLITFRFSCIQYILWLFWSRI